MFVAFRPELFIDKTSLFIAKTEKFCILDTDDCVIEFYTPLEYKDFGEEITVYGVSFLPATNQTFVNLVPIKALLGGRFIVSNKGLCVEGVPVLWAELFTTVRGRDFGRSFMLVTGNNLVVARVEFYFDIRLIAQHFYWAEKVGDFLRICFVVQVEGLDGGYRDVMVIVIFNDTQFVGVEKVYGLRKVNKFSSFVSEQYELPKGLQARLSLAEKIRV